MNLTLNRTLIPNPNPNPNRRDAHEPGETSCGSPGKHGTGHAAWAPHDKRLMLATWAPHDKRLMLATWAPHDKRLMLAAWAPHDKRTHSEEREWHFWRDVLKCIAFSEAPLGT